VIIDYDLDQSLQAALVVTMSPSNQCHSNSPKATTTTNESAKELLSIKKEISDLKALITTAMEQFRAAIKSLSAPPQSSKSNMMDTEVDQSTATHNPPTLNSPNLSAIITELKHGLAAFVHETRELLQQEKCAFIPFQLSPMLM